MNKNIDENKLRYVKLYLKNKETNISYVVIEDDEYIDRLILLHEDLEFIYNKNFIYKVKIENNKAITYSCQNPFKKPKNALSNFFINFCLKFNPYQDNSKYEIGCI